MAILGSDPFFGVDATASVEHRVTHEGRSFSVSRKDSGVPVGGTSDLLLVTSSGVNPHIRKFSATTTRGPCDLFLYRSPVVSALGTPVQIHNSFDGHPRTPQMAVYHTPTVVSPGAEICYSLLPDQYSPNEGELDVSEERVLNLDTQYLLRLDVGGFLAVDVGWRLFFYELGLLQ